MPTERSSAGDPARTLQLLWREPGPADPRRGPRQRLSVERVAATALTPEDHTPPRLRRPATSLHSGQFRDSYATTAQSVPTQSKTDFRFAEKVSQQ